MVNHGDLGAANFFQVLFVEGAELPPGKRDLASEQAEGWVGEEPEHRQDSKGLTGAALTDDAQFLAGEDVEVDPADDLSRASVLIGPDGDAPEA